MRHIPQLLPRKRQHMFWKKCCIKIRYTTHWKKGSVIVLVLPQISLFKNCELLQSPSENNIRSYWWFMTPVRINVDPRLLFLSIARFSYRDFTVWRSWNWTWIYTENEICGESDNLQEHNFRMRKRKCSYAKMKELVHRHSV